MNKVFKIVFNAARGTRMVVNETTSSVQSGKKAAVTVAVVGALAAGTAMAAESVSGVWLVTDQSVKTFNAASGVPTGVQRVTTTLITEETVFDNGVDVSLTVNDETGKIRVVRGIQNIDQNVTFKKGLKIATTAQFNGGKSGAATSAYDQYSQAETNFKTTVNGSVDLSIDLTTKGRQEWANALRVNGGDFIAQGAGKDSSDSVKLVATSAVYTAQTLGYGMGSDLTFKDYAQVDIAAEGTGANVIADLSTSSGTVVTFENIGTLNLTATAKEAVSNAYGVQLKGNEKLVVKNTDTLNVTINGSGRQDNGDTAGTGAFILYEEATADITADKVTVSVNSGEGLASSLPTDYSCAQGIRVEGVNASFTLNGDLDVTVTDKASKAVGIKNLGTTSLLGNVKVTANSETEAIAVDVQGGKLTLGSAGKTVDLTGNVEVASGAELILNGETSLNGVADIQGTLAGDGQLLIDSADSKVDVSAATEVSDSMTFGTTGELTDKLGGKVEEVADKFVGVDEIVMQEGDVIGQTTATLAQDGTITGVTQAVNKKTEALAEQVTLAPQMITRIMMNDVRKRMGDLRAAEGTHGVWARYNGGQMAGSGMESDFHMVQVGIDTVPVADAPRFGVAFSYAQSEAEATNGLATTDMDSFSLAFYGTKMYDSGMFVDVIGRMATMDTEMNVQGNKAQMDNVALSLSGELGWRFDVTDRFFFEPSVEATYTYTNADRFTMGSGNYELEAVDSLVGRAGFAAGFKCPADKGDVYVRAAVVHEFMGDTTMRSGVGGTFNAAPVEMDGKDTWFEYAIGANFNLNKNTYVYADIERTEGATMDEDWRANVGVRFAF